MLLFLMFVLYLVQMLFRRDSNDTEDVRIKYPPVVSALLLLGSIILIALSSDLIVDSAQNIARAMHISEKNYYNVCYCSRNKFTRNDYDDYKC